MIIGLVGAMIVTGLHMHRASAGLAGPPAMFPSWLDRLSVFLPSRAGRDLVMWTSAGAGMPVSTVWCVAAWAIGTLVAALWAYRRDEGRRLR